MSRDPTYNIGDKISYYGGEGTVVKKDGRVLYIHTEDGEITEQKSNLPMVNRTSTFESGERIQFPGGNGEILKIDERSDAPDLLFVRTEDDKIKEVPADKKGVEPLADIADTLTARQFDTPERFDLLSNSTQLDLAYRFDRFLSLGGSRIDVTPHQVEAAHEILSSHDHRYLIADEVGLGKTIEAGIVIEELIARGRAERVLIITPASLKMQWQAEMADKFDQEYVVYERDYVNTIQRARRDDNVWEHDDQVITSIDFAKQDDLREQLENTEWDIVVIDEAHHLTARRDNKGGKSRTKRHRVGEAVSPNTDALLFLTGTPHKGKADQFYFMVDLLEPYRFENEDDISPEKLDDLMIRRLKTNPNMVHPDGTPMFPEKDIQTLSVEFTEEERALYEDITNYLRTEYRRGEDQASQAAGFSMVIYQKRLVSSIRAIQKSLENRANALEYGGEGSVSKVVEKLLPQYRESPETLTDEQRDRIERELESVAGDQDPEDRQRELEAVRALIERAKAIEVDSKAERLRKSILSLLESSPDEKILVFTEYTDTLRYLRDEVLSDLDSTQIHGGLTQTQRREEVEKFRGDANIMLATDAAREGINLQFAHIMVNYDLPWNPIRIDQRMGRLHRYGQDQKVNIYNLFVEDTRESQILEHLVSKIDQIEDDLGMSSDVLGMVLEDSDFDFQDRIMDAIEDDEPEDAVVRDVEAIIDERKEAVKKIQDNFLITDQFGESELEEVQELINQSQDEYVGQEAVKRTLELLFSELDGSLSRKQQRQEGMVYSVTTPSVLELDSEDLLSSYDRVTFDQALAKADSSVEFLSVNHPLIRAAVEYCLDGDWIDGKTTLKRTENPGVEPGILCNFRIGCQTADEREEVEEYVSLYVTESGDIIDQIPETDAVNAVDDAASHDSVDAVIEDADRLIDIATREAQRRAEQLADDVESEKAEAVAVKRQHAERYFKNAIETWESRLRQYRQDDRDGKDMTVSIRRAESELEDLRAQRKHEFEKLAEEESVLPKTHDLVNAAVVIPSGSS